MATSHEASDGTAQIDRRDSRTQDSGIGRISLFGRDLPVIVVLVVLAFPAVGAFLGASAGAGSVSAVATVVPEFGAMVGAVGSNLQSLIAQVGTGPSIAAVSATVLTAKKLTN